MAFELIPCAVSQLTNKNILCYLSSLAISTRNEQTFIKFLDSDCLLPFVTEILIKIKEKFNF
jgi:hypothetical protein